MARDVSAQCHEDTLRKIPAILLPLYHRRGLGEKRIGHLMGLLSMLCQFNNYLSILKILIYRLLSAGESLSWFLKSSGEFHLFHLPPEYLNSLWLSITVPAWMRYCSQSRKILAVDGPWWGDSEEITEISRQ